MRIGGQPTPRTSSRSGIARLAWAIALLTSCFLRPASFVVADLKTVFQRGGTLVVHKPAGLSSEQRDAGGESALQLLRARHPEAQLPHRLDRMTGGALVVATEREDLCWHNAAIKERRWGPKIYVARLAGTTVRLGEHRAYMKEKGKRAEVGKGKTALQEVLFAAPAPSLEGTAVDAVILLRTGRYHQIRAMMASEGVPVLGDKLYGSNSRHTPLLTHAILGLPLPDGEFHVARSSQLAPRGCPPVSDGVRSCLDSLAADLLKEQRGQR